ncbi:MAG: lipopolysaccharide biosynthesis protein [Methanomassiliicoccus sp.]|nr:lipopolysaccharide biosynthesis protein [Methanomassiliicoccus sp.]
MPDDLKSNVLSSLFWKFLEGGGVTGIQFVVQIILARLLLPEDFGIIALIIVFISISQAFVQSGLGTALVQKKEVTDEDLSSVLFLSLGIALVFYCILFVAAPFIASFYHQPIIAPVLRVLGLTLFFAAVNSIQKAVVARNFQFRRLFISSLGAVLLSGAIGIAMAYGGFQVWALVGQQLTSMVALCVIMWFTVRWRPHLLFSLPRVKGLFSYGWKLLASSLMDVTCNNVYPLVIGKIYPPNVLGYFVQGQVIPKTLIENVDTSIQAVMLPAYCKKQDDRPQLKQMMRRAMVTSSFIVFPAMVGLAAVAKPLVVLILTDKWLPSVLFLQIFCAVYALWPIHTANLQAINAIGRSDIFLKLDVVKRTVDLGILAVSILFGIYAIALGMVLSGVIATFINAYPNRKLLDYSFTEQWRDIVPSLVLSLVMGGLVYSVLFLGLSTWVTLISQIAIGLVTYLGLAWALKLDSLMYAVGVVSEYFSKLKEPC